MRWNLAARVFSALFLLGLATTVAHAADATPDPMDWPTWRGPEQNGTSREKDLIDKWDYEGTNVLWQNKELAGISTPICMRGKLYTIVRDQPDTKREREKVICVDAATGKKIWESAFNVFLSDVPAERVGWSCCVGDPTTGRVFAMGVCGFFQCLEGDTGKTVWSHSLNEEFGLLSTYGGRTNVPVVFEDNVIISAVFIGLGDMARPAHRLLCFDKNTGTVRWFNGTRPLPEDTTYSTPFLTVLNGQAAMVFGSGDGAVWAFQPRTGKPIWSYQLSRRGLNVSPIVADNKVYTGHAEENNDNTTMGGVLCIDGSGTGDMTTGGTIWRNDGMVGKSSPLLIDGRVYAFDDGGKVYTFDAKTGKPVGKPTKLIGTIVRSSPLFADGKIYICSTSAWHVFEPTKDGLKKIHQLRLNGEDEVTGSPICSHGRIYLPTGSQMLCLGTKDQKPSADPIPPAPKETPASPSDEATILQVVPAESLVKPGEKVKFTVRAFNARGQFLSETKADYSLDGPGEVDNGGQFTAASGQDHTITIVKATSGKLTAEARVRVVPPLPWKFNFNEIPLAAGPTGRLEGEPPVTWVGARYRHKIRELDGEKVMVKVTTIPKGTRSQSLMGPVDLHDYTIQADVRGALTNNKLPDAGVIAQRYTFDLMGASQQVQIRSWTPQLHRFSKSVPYKWSPNTWYTLKFQASTQDGKAILKGKVWPRGEKEPAEWTVEAVDEAPNLIGSPGLFGNANDSEIYIDNISVTPNSAS